MLQEYQSHRICQGEKTNDTPIIKFQFQMQLIVIAIIFTRTGSHTIKYMYKQDNLTMGAKHIQCVANTLYMWSGGYYKQQLLPVVQYKHQSYNNRIMQLH